LSRYTGLSGQGRAVSAIDSFAFVGTTSELLKLSSKNPDTLRLVSSMVINSGISGVFATNSAVFVSLGTANGALAIGYSSGVDTTILSSYGNNENCHDICAYGPFIYLAAQDRVDILRFIR
jgi:hypothetical protein